MNNEPIARDSVQVFSEGCIDLWNEVEDSIWRQKDPPPVRDPQSTLAVTLFEEPRWIPPRFLYDEKGSHLFEEITRLPEYYLTRTEDEILAGHAPEIVASAGAEMMVELGAGFSRKTAHLLTGQQEQHGGGIFAPVDVSMTALRASREAVQGKYRLLCFHGICAHYEEGIASINPEVRTLFVFLGSTLGNFDGESFANFFTLLGDCMEEGDLLLLGVDRIKDPEILEAAYNDSRGVTAEFITNVLVNVNRLTGSNFDPGKVSYQGVYNESRSRMEMYLTSEQNQNIELPARKESFTFRKGERILVEVSRKFDPEVLRRQLSGFCLEPVTVFSDADDWFSILLFRKCSNVEGEE